MILINYKMITNPIWNNPNAVPENIFYCVSQKEIDKAFEDDSSETKKYIG